MGHTVEIFNEIKDNRNFDKVKRNILSEANLFAQYNVDRLENPSGSYHGNMKFMLDKVFDSLEDAENYLESTIGDYKDVAVKYYDLSKAKSSKKYLTLTEKIKELEEKIVDLDIKNRKAKTVSCSCCGKRNELSLTKESRCLFCLKDLRKFNTVKKERELIKKRDSLKNAKKDFLIRAKQKAKIYWAFKVEVHC